MSHVQIVVTLFCFKKYSVYVIKGVCSIHGFRTGNKMIFLADEKGAKGPWQEMSTTALLKR